VGSTKILNLESAKELINELTTVFWFRRDLRLTDNAGLYHALKESGNVVALFIFDSVILEALDDKQDARVDFIHQSLHILNEELNRYGTRLLVVYGNPVNVFAHLASKAVYANEDYEPYARSRDAKVKDILEKKGSKFFSFKDQVIFEKSEITKDNGHPYTVFTPFSRKWKSALNKFYLKSYPTEKYAYNFKKHAEDLMLSLQDIGFTKSNITFPARLVKTSLIKSYDKTRDFPSVAGTSRLSVHLRFGTISIRKLAQVARKNNETWLNELIWREFYQMILWHFPQVVNECFKSEYNRIQWRNNEQEFERWCNGTTGYPIVDAGMRELNTTGFMHNRVRMVVASFLTKHLLIDWRWGESYFAKKLLDYELASNNGGWQWAAGCGCDAAPYFRVFNPALQEDRFDKDGKYVTQWIPELSTDKYPKPIVEHKFARDRAIKVFQKALRQET
jgi:deoxyribodipyrimidine photo-lyase